MAQPHLSPRKLPMQARAQATRNAIVEAAAQVIEAGGLDAFNTNTVAERAGVSIGSLYQYFPNKDSIMAELIRHTQEQRIAALARTLNEPHATLPDLIRAIVRSVNEQHRNHSLLAAAIDYEEARLPVQEEIDGFLAISGHALRAVFGRFPVELADINPDRAARTLPALVRSVVDSWANLVPPQPEIAEDEAVRAICGYLCLVHSDGVFPLHS